MGRIRILLAESQALFREAVTIVLEDQDDLQVVGAVSEGRELVELAGPARPDVVVLDTGLPDGDWADLAARVREEAEGCKILVLAEEGDDASLVRAVEAGVSGYITKGSLLEDLIEATRRIHRGETLIPGDLLGRLLDRFVQREHEHEEAYRLISRLTPREKEVLAMLAQGAANEEIGRALLISHQTVRKHVQHVLQKLGVHSRVEAAAFVLRSARLAEVLTGDRAAASG